MIAGLSAGLLIGAVSEAAADGGMQLRPPLNSSLTIRSAENTWTARPTAAVAPAADAKSAPAAEAKGAPVVEAKSAPVDETAIALKNDQAPSTSDDLATPPGKKSVQAITASGPLDRFRGPLAKRPSTKAGDEPSTTQLGQPSVQTPGDQVLDRLATPSLPSSGAWQGRPVGQKSDAFQSTTSPPQVVQEPDGFRSPISEGNWVARDAINRIAPLQDPVARPARQLQRQPVASQLPAQTQAVTPRAQPDAVPVEVSSNAASASKSNVTSQSVQRQAESAAQAAPLTQSDDGFINRSRSMSLGEARNAVESSEPVRAESPTRAERDASLELEQPVPNSAADSADVETDPSAIETQRLEKLPASRPQEVRDLSGKPEATAKAIEQKRVQPEPAQPKPAQPKPAQPKPAQPEPTQLNSADVLPKRKPLANIVEAELSSTKREVAKPLQRMPDVEQSATELRPESGGAKASVGDLSPAENQVLDYTGHPASEIRPTRTVANLRGGIERTLRYFYDRPEVASGRSNWGMMHSLMVFGADTQLIVGREKYNAIAWIAGNNNCRGQRLLTHDANGIQAKSGVGLQGHQGQFLAVMGMCNVPTSYPLHAGKMKYDVAALIEAEKKACKAGEELTFTLIGLSHYLDTDSTWIADDGTEWDFERLIAEELKQPIVGAACGGTHRLMGYTHALRKRRAEGKPITGQWQRAETYTADFIKYAYSLQNRDGSMSTDWFEGRADDGKVDRKIQTTGHIVEWLLTVTPDDQLQDRRLVAAVSFLLRSVGSDLDHDWSIGPKGHALRSLAMYHQRVFRAGTPWIPTSLARSGQAQRR